MLPDIDNTPVSPATPPWETPKTPAPVPAPDQPPSIKTVPEELVK